MRMREFMMIVYVGWGLRNVVRDGVDVAIVAVGGMVFVST